MNKILLGISALILCVYGSGEFTILHHPSSILFKGHTKLDESILPEVYSAALGISIERSSSWNGMYLTDPFNLAEAIVTVEIDGITNLDTTKGHHFPLRTDEDDVAIFDDIQRRVEERNPVGNNKFVRIELSDGLDALNDYSFLHGIKHIKPQKNKYQYLKLNVDEEYEFMQELNLLNAIIDKIESGVVSKDHNSDVFWFKFSGLHALSDLHGENSSSTKEAKQLLKNAISRLNDAFNKAYGGSVLVNVITSDFSHTRRARNLLAADSKDEIRPEDLKLAKTYGADYPVIFNIILWFGVVMVFSLLAIALTIGNMDPGRDSIIYRMTSTRMKKDN